MTFVLAKVSLKLGFTKMLSKILAETKFVQKVLTTLNLNFSKTKTFFIDKCIKHDLQNYKTDLLLFSVKLCKNSNICVLL